MKALKSIFNHAQYIAQQRWTSHSIKRKSPSLMPATDNITPLQKTLIEQVELSYRLAESQLNLNFIRPSVGFKLRGKCAGMAHLQHNHLRFNPLLFINNSQAFLSEVVPHEICHLLVYQIFGKVKPHGKEWRNMMRQVFNVSPRTTHDFDISPATEVHFRYQCHCGPVHLSLRRHNKVLRGKTQYCCRRCKIQLTLMPERPT
ncbi:SprT family zinc-dependent metalloprotease [Shewanella surugensis]|uniref:SprT family zinc-dependent metalloprotease n=1 Tax=Shewanella surugensis TaxID=212020 RepID=A0ABT0L8N3_9GAMM|nr:SprT family zinc-dependent metalloprotease [Shewanella surugensis]MCL1124066.1 SprT family zinc-dependent metalloprotease [Shewanella surugensis]